MLTSSRFGVQYPQSTDTPDVVRDLTQIVTQGIERAILHGGSGALASRPTSSPGTPGIVGRLYAATDQSPPRLFFDFGTGWFDVGALVAGSVTTSMIAAGAITATQIATDTITASQIAPNAVGASEIADGSIGNVELAPNSVAQSNMQTNSVGTPQLQANSVTFAKIGSDVPVVPVGATMDWPWASGSIPAWAVLPYGQLLTQAAYPAMQVLADASSRPFGGAAGTNFNMPDMRGRVAAGKDDMGGTTAGRITAAVSGTAGTVLGAVVGSEGIAITTAQLPAHNHALTGGINNNGTGIGINAGVTGITLTGRTAAHTHSTDTNIGAGGFASGSIYSNQIIVSNPAGRYGVATFPSGTESSDHTHTVVEPNSGTGHGHSVSDPQHGHTHTFGIANTGSGSTTPVAQPTIIVNKIMRVL